MTRDDPKSRDPHQPCDSAPDWQGCECDLDKGHEGPHECVCGAQWDDWGRKIKAGYQDDKTPGGG